MERIVKPGQIYKHFKGYIINVLYVAKHSETLEELVIYKHDKSDDIWARPINLFLSQVDHDKYPEVIQKYRFELINDMEA